MRTLVVVFAFFVLFVSVTHAGPFGLLGKPAVVGGCPDGSCGAVVEVPVRAVIVPPIVVVPKVVIPKAVVVVPAKPAAKAPDQTKAAPDQVALKAKRPIRIFKRVRLR